MATIDIVCPSCNHASKAPAELKGKKIRCKQCKNVFVAGSASGPPAHIVRPQHADAEIDRNPYGVTDTNLAARCPFCAMAMDPPDARICLHCGYDLQKRRRVDSRKTYETTFLDYLVWHLSTFGCFVGILVVIGICVYSGFQMRSWNDGSWFEEYVPDGCYTTWIAIMGLALIWVQARFIFKKLVYHIHPPEKIKRDKTD